MLRYVVRENKNSLFGVMKMSFLKDAKKKAEEEAKRAAEAAKKAGEKGAEGAKRIGEKGVEKTKEAVKKAKKRIE
jgi:colicin import membrane protein